MNLMPEKFASALVSPVYLLRATYTVSNNQLFSSVGED